MINLTPFEIVALFILLAIVLYVLVWQQRNWDQEWRRRELDKHSEDRRASTEAVRKGRSNWFIDK